MYNLLNKICIYAHRIKHIVIDYYYELVYSIQKINRPKHHRLDKDIFGLYYHLAKIIYPKLKVFRNSELRNYPANLKNIEEWLSILDEMIFAFGFILVGDDSNKRLGKKFKRKYGDWNREIESNKKELKWYKNKKNGDMMIMIPDSKKEVDLDIWEYHHSDNFYYNSELYFKLSERCDKGLELFGKYFRGLWR